jgi:hypothetical protein
MNPYTLCSHSERLPVKEHFVAPLAAAKCIIDGAQQALASSAASVCVTPLLLT